MCESGFAGTVCDVIRGRITVSHEAADVENCFWYQSFIFEKAVNHGKVCKDIRVHRRAQLRDEWLERNSIAEISISGIKYQNIHIDVVSEKGIPELINTGNYADIVNVSRDHGF